MQDLSPSAIWGSVGLRDSAIEFRPWFDFFRKTVSILSSTSVPLHSVLLRRFTDCLHFSLLKIMNIDVPLDLELKSFNRFPFLVQKRPRLLSSVLFVRASRQCPVSFRQAVDAQVAQQDVSAPVRQTQNVLGQRLSRCEAHFVVVKHVFQVLHNLLLLKTQKKKKHYLAFRR